MTTTESILSQLKRECDEAKKQLDAVASRRDAVRLQRQQLIDAADYAQSVLQMATGRGDLDGMRNATARIAEIKKNRDELFDVIAALSVQHQLLQGKYSEALYRWQHEENTVEFLTRRITTLRRELATAQQRTSAYSVYNNNTSPEALSSELRACEDKYLVLAGEGLPPIAA